MPITASFDHDALEAWRVLAPKFRLHLECSPEGYEVYALDDELGEWVPIVQHPDPADAMAKACVRLSRETPLRVAHMALSTEGS